MVIPGGPHLVRDNQHDSFLPHPSDSKHVYPSARDSLSIPPETKILLRTLAEGEDTGMLICLLLGF